MKLHKIIIFSITAVFILSASAAAETVFFEDDFDYTVADANLSQISDVWSTEPWFDSTSRFVKVGSNWAGRAYYSNNFSGDQQLRLAEAELDSQLVNYTVTVDAYWHETFPCNMYAAARVSGADDSNYIIAGAAIGDGGGLYAKAKDSNGVALGDNYMCQYEPNQPIEIQLSVDKNDVVVKVSHLTYSETIEFTTTVTDAGSPGFGGQVTEQIYSKAYFDNFKVTGKICGDPGTLTLKGDVNDDCNVDFEDFATMAINWMKCSDPSDAGCDQYWK